MRKLFRHEVKSAAIELEQFKARLQARFFLLLIFITQVGQRLYFVLIDKQTRASTSVYETSFPFLGGLIIIVLGEALLYKKIGVKVLKYTGYISALFFLVATAEWMVTLYAAVVRSIRCGNVAGYNVPSIFGFTSFSWRIMMQVFIVQRWYLRIIAPTMAYGMVMGYGIHVAPQSTGMILVRGLLQVAYIIFIFYFEQRINFKLLFTTLHQEKWLKMNEFILNNIPEKIAIIDVDGVVQFTSEYFKHFMKKCGHPDDIHTLCKEIKDLQQHYENDMLSVSGPDRSSLERSVSVAASREPNIERAETLDELIKGFRTLIASGTVTEGSFLVFNGRLMAEGTQQEKSIEVKISFNKQQTKQFIILLLRDTTQRDQIVSLEASNKYKDHLLASVSHELRTPLNGTINLVETALSSRKIPENIKEDLLGPALNSSKFLLHLINDILDMSQIKAEKLRLIFQEGSIKETIANAVKLLDLNARMKGISLSLHMDPEVPKMICTDHVRLSQIVLNLVHNSIKFTPAGQVQIKVQPVNGMPWIKVIVKDSGIGMSKEDIKKLFNVFTHIELHNRVNINPTGAGLGLSIAHNLAQLLGPKESNGIKVISVPEEGSTFSFLIEDRSVKEKPEVLVLQKRMETNSIMDEKEESPLVINDNDFDEEPRGYQRVVSYLSTKSIKALTSVGIELTRDECRCPKLLIVDDDAFNMLAYKSILATLGLKCDCVYSGKAGIDKLIWRVSNPCSRDCKGYQLVFMDQEMPGMNGAETVTEIKKLEAEKFLPETRVIGCTAHKDGPEIQQFLQSGLIKCIEKPISVGIIKDLLQEYQIIDDDI